ncbi:MAG TPA: LysR family transcriptional regulator [Leptospiraceae bacterium]|nr:LysR family transcriptional regulator [Spirochaetaceae bacterium]HBS03823.1 LysR family transcriptional regulator [Leptospiraceae bacterium]
MEFRQIRYFLEIHRQGSFSKAASALGLTQPALSRQIAVLEKELGHTVFERNTRELFLTEAGRRLLEKAIPLQDLWKETLESVSNLESGNPDRSIQGDFRISTGGTMAAYVLPSLIRNLRISHPDLTLQIIEGDLRTSRDAVLWGDADLGILTEKEYHGELEYRTFLEDEIVPVVAREHKLASRKKIAIKDLLREDFVFYHPHSAIRNTIEDHLQKQGIRFSFKVSMELRSVDAVIRSVEAELGIGFVSRRSVGSSLHVLPVRELIAPRKFHISWRKGRPGLLPLVEVLLDCASNL